MKFKKSSIPTPDVGISYLGVIDQVVPDQSLKLQDILQRFVRKEALPVGHPSRYGSDGEIDPESDSPFNIDQEKARHWDLTEKQEFRDEVMKAREEFESARKAQEKAEAEKKAKADQEAFEKKVRIAARKYAKENPGNRGSI